MLARYRMPIALVAGVTAGWLGNWLVFEVIPTLTDGAIQDHKSAPWIATLFSTSFVVNLMVPGFIAGLVAGRRGILIGASTAVVLAIIAVLPEVFVVVKAPERPIGDVATLLLAVFTRYPASIIASAVAGGCGELLRSNTSLERTREG